MSERRTYFKKLSGLISVPGARIALAPDSIDRAWRSADILIHYPGLHLAELGKSMSPFVRLEVGAHPLVTLLEKLDALYRRFPYENADPATFIRHYEDARESLRLPPDVLRSRTMRTCSP